MALVPKLTKVGNREEGREKREDVGCDAHGILSVRSTKLHPRG